MTKVIVLLLICFSALGQNRTCTFNQIQLSTYDNYEDTYYKKETSYSQVTIVFKADCVFWYNLDKEAISETMYYHSAEFVEGTYWKKYVSHEGHKMYVDDLCQLAYYFDPNLTGIRLTFKL